MGESFLNRGKEPEDEHGKRWARKALINVGGMGRFSSDRTVAEYARETWNIRAYRD